MERALLGEGARRAPSRARRFRRVLARLGVDGTAAHIHDGAPGKNGPVIIPLTKSGNDWTVPAGAKLTDEQYKDFQAGNLYVNVHSAENKNGEIRGNLSPR